MPRKKCQFIDDAAEQSDDGISDGGTDDSDLENGENVEGLVDDTNDEHGAAPSEAAFEPTAHGDLNFMVASPVGGAGRLVPLQPMVPRADLRNAAGRHFEHDVDAAYQTVKAGLYDPSDRTPQGFLGTNVAERGGLVLSGVSEVSANGETVVLAGRHKSMGYLQKGDTDLRPVAFANDGTARLVSVGVAGATLSLWQQLLELVRHHASEDEEDEFESSQVIEVPQCVTDVLGYTMDALVSDTCETSGLGIEVVWPMVNVACQGEKPRPHNPFVMAGISRTQYNKAVSAVAPVRKAVVGSRTWVSETAKSCTDRHHAFACIDALLDNPTELHSLLLASVGGPLMVFVTDHVLDAFAGATVCWASTKGDQVVVMVPMSVPTPDCAAEVDKAARSFCRTFSAFEVRPNGAVSATVEDLGGGVPCHLRFVVEEAMASAAGVQQRPVAKIAWPKKERKRSYMIASDSEEEDSSEAPPKKASVDPVECLMEVAAEEASPMEEDPEVDAASAEREENTPLEEDPESSADDDIDYMLPPTVSYVIAADTMMFVHQLPTAAYMAFGRDTFHTLIVESRKQMADLYCREEGSVETWINKKWSNEYLPQLYDLLLCVLEQYTKTAIGHWIPTGTDMPNGVLDPDTIIALPGGHFVPRVIGLPAKVDGVAGVARARTVLRARSRVNLNHWTKLEVYQASRPVTIRDVVEYFSEFVTMLGVHYPTDPDDAVGGPPIDHSIAFVPDKFKSASFWSNFVKHLIGSEKGDGQMSHHLLSQTRRIGLVREPRIHRFMWALPDNYVLLLTKDGGVVSDNIYLSKANGDFRAYRFFDVPIVRVKQVITKLRACIKEAGKFHKPASDDERHDEFQSTVLRPFFELMTATAPRTSSFFVTQFVGDETRMWDPANVDALTDDQRIVTIADLGNYARPWGNSGLPQQLASKQGQGGTGKSAAIGLFIDLFDGCVVPVNNINKSPTFWAARFLETDLCTREGVYPFGFFVASDRKNDEGGAKVPQPIWDEMIGYDDTVTVDAEGKHRDATSVRINPLGCFDQGNAAPTTYVADFKAGKITANQVLLLTVGGDREGLGNNAERRIVCSTPSMIITDATSRRCMIQKSTRLFGTMKELFNTEALWVLLFSFTALKIIMASELDHTGTDLHLEITEEWIMMNEHNAKAATEGAYEEQPAKRTIALFRELYGDTVQISVVNVVPLDRLLDHAKLQCGSLNRKHLECLFGPKSRESRVYSCKHCGIGLVGKRNIAKELAEHGAHAKNKEINDLMSSPCCVSIAKVHEFGRHFTSPPGWRMVDGAPAVA